MNDSKAWKSDVSSLLNNIYRCADKSSWYSEVAESYDRTRPRYPPQIMARLQEIAQLQPGKIILEIGAGPGIASVSLAQLGVNMVCLEPSLSACRLAQSNCANYSQVEFINTTFEAWELKAEKFDAIVATTSFHWVTPGVRTKKTAAALKENGLLVLLWNTPPQLSYEACNTVADVYQTYAPDLGKYETFPSYQKNLSKMGQEIIDSGYFKDLVEEKLISQVTYSVDDYLTLLSTLSPYIKLEKEQRTTLLRALQKVLQSNYGDRLELSYLSMLQIACKNE